jgi:flagellar protein FliS
MKKEALKGFTARIAQASRSELTVLLYEVILMDIEEARSAYNDKDMATFEKELKHAQKFVSELMATLDYQYTLSYDLLSLYLFVNKSIITAIMKKDLEALKAAEAVMKRLLAGFEQVSKDDKSGPIMQNIQQVYAGLTYGKGTLNETFIDPNNQSRGFMA